MARSAILAILYPPSREHPPRVIEEAHTDSETLPSAWHVKEFHFKWMWASREAAEAVDGSEQAQE